MYRFEDPFVVYGWRERNHELVINSQWTEENNVRIFSTDLSKNLATEAVYGEACELNYKSAKITVDKKCKRNVEKAYAIYVQQAQNIGKEVDDLGYYLALDGDMDWSQKRAYTPGVSMDAISMVLVNPSTENNSDEDTVIEEKPKSTKVRKPKK